jgi:hypothetical protein
VNDAVKQSLFALAAAGAGHLINKKAVPTAVWRTFEQEAKHANYLTLSDPSSQELKNKVIQAHQNISGLKKPTVYRSNDPNNLGSYTMEPGGSGYVSYGPNAHLFTLAHELGHRAIHKQPGIFSSIQENAPDLASSPLALPALIGLAASKKSNIGALANTVGLSYLAQAPLIASEIEATRRGMKYLSAAGTPGNWKLAVSQAVPYLLAPAATGLLATAAGRGLRMAGEKIKSRLKKTEIIEDPEAV